MSSSNGTEYYLKSMNGIKSFDDGSGTIIEDDAITIATVNATDINCENLSTNSITSAGNLTVNGDITTSAKISAGFLEVENNISCENITARTAMYANTIEPTINNIDINLFTTTTGIVKIGTAKKVSLGTIIADDSLIITNGNIGTLKTAIIQPPSLITQIDFYKNTALPLYFTNFKFLGQTIEPAVPSTITSLLTTSTATINIGGIGKIKIGDNIVIHAKALTSLLASDDITLFNNITGGTLDIGNGITTGIMNIATSLGSAGIINMCSNLIFKNSSIASTGATNTISLFNNITTGIVQMCSNLVFQQNRIQSTGSGDTMRLFANITTGDLKILENSTNGSVTIGNAVATTGNGGAVNIGIGRRNNVAIGSAFNNSTAINNGCCTINKLQVGSSPSIREVRFGTVAGGSSNNTVSFSPAFPTGITPIIFGTINSSNTGLIYSLVFTSVSNVSFRYNKIQTNGGGGGVGPATSESFDWYAMSS